MPHVLDNPVWNALNTGNKDLAQGSGNVKFYRPAISLFAGLAENSHDNLRTLHAITPAEENVLAVVSPEKTGIPQPWTVLHGIAVFQMVCERPAFREAITAPVVNLADEHIPQMLALTELTKPGPFGERTIDFGHYQGIFDDGRLVAMAGQRMHATPYAEISAVCTHPEYTGRGYGAQLMLSQIKRITDAGEIPFLHVTTSNARAIKLYQSLGFLKRKELFVHVIQK